jgi:glycerate-2-kinase
MIKNRDELSEGAEGEALLDTIDKTLESVKPDRLVSERLKVFRGRFTIRREEDSVSFQLGKFKNIYVIGWGKASGLMAEGIEKILPIKGGIVNVLRGTHFNVKHVRLQEAEHPIPGAGSLEGTRKMLEYAKHIGKNDLVICLISGGGSALLSQPIEGLKLEEKQEVIDRLMKAGANINELNTVRKHLSQVKGGRLAEKLYPATVVNLIISDVVGDPLDVISSGPTVPDSTTFSDAKKILLKYKLWDDSNACRIIEAGVNGNIKETPKPGDPVFKNVHSFIIGSNEVALLAAKKRLELYDMKPEIIRNIRGDAREAGKMFAALLKKGKTFIAGGETTVRVTGKGIGGRNQEMALACALEIAGIEGILFASFGTDGIDGSSPADGAIVDGTTIKRGEELGLDALEFQRNNDSYSLFKKIGACIITGPTRTNVNDVMIGIEDARRLKSR